MSKELRHSVPCSCGQRFAFPEYHLPHCKFKPSATKKPQPIVPVAPGAIADRPIAKKNSPRNSKKTRGVGR